MDKIVTDFSIVLFFWILFVAVFGIAIIYGVYKVIRKYIAEK